MKQQAQYIWDRLEDLSASDPDAYKSFIDKQMEEKKIFMSSPQAELCIHTSANMNNELVQVFINVCSWKRMPDVKTDQDPIQMMAGFKTKYQTNKKDKGSMCIPIAINDRILKEILSNGRDKRDLIELVLELVRKNVKVKTVH